MSDAVTAGADAGPRAVAGRRTDVLARWTTCVLLVTGGIVLVLIVAFLVRESGDVLTDPRALWGLLAGDAWHPLGDRPTYGIRHALVSSLLVTAAALAVAVPVGVGIGVFLSDVAPAPVRAVVRPCVQLLAGVPSVVYGFFGFVTIVRWLETSQGMPTGECVLAASAVLAVMVLPFIAGTSAEACAAISAELRESAIALGVSRWHLVRRIVLRAAAPGLVAAVLLGLARAVGETFAVMMLCGNSTAMPGSLLHRAQPLTALLATELGEAGVGSEKYQALFAAGLVLLVAVMILNAALGRLGRRLAHVGG